MAYSAIFVVVIMISFNQIAARPAETNEVNVVNQRFKRSEIDRLSKFKLPTILQDEDAITIKGTISNDAKRFSIVLPSSSGGKTCRIKYDFTTKAFYISPTLSPESEQTFYNISGETITFWLELKARFVESGLSMFYMSFEANEAEKNGLVGLPSCEVENFDDIGYIEIEEGIDSITSVNFQFS